MSAPVSPFTGLQNLQSRALLAESRATLGFVMVNETRNLVQYRQAVLWDGAGRVSAVSGVSKPERSAPYTLWLEALFAEMIDTKPEPGLINQGEISDKLRASWSDWLPPQAMWLPFGEGLGGLIYARDEAWSQPETEFLQGLSLVYAAASQAKRGHERSNPILWGKKRFVQIGVVVALIAVSFLPVPLSVLAPAEIVAANPLVVRAPYEGVMDKIYVTPNQIVEAGQLLFELDDTALSSKLKVAIKVLATAKAEYEQVTQKALYDLKAKNRLAILKGKTEEKSAEVEQLRTLLERIRVRAKGAGVVIVDDPSEWIGRPVSIGERVMAIAQERDTEVEAWLSVGDAVELQAGSPMKIFLNTSPLNALRAEVRYAAYRALERPDGTLAYRIRANLMPTEEKPRLGLKGTARIETGRVTLFYWMMRRPIATIRQYVGL